MLSEPEQHFPIIIILWILPLYFLDTPPKMPRKSKIRIQHSPLETANVKAAEGPAFPNTGSTLFKLPLELIMEILSYFNCLPIITNKLNLSLFGINPKVSRRYLERTDALRALSQTCRSWRNLFLPLLWERLESCCSVMDIDSGNRFESNMNSLIRKSALVCENPEIASHVRCVQVRILWEG